MQNQMNDQLLVQILQKGIKLQDNTLVGYTKNQLKVIGLDKNILNKGVKLGLVKKIYVSSKDTPFSQVFYCVECPKEESKAESTVVSETESEAPTSVPSSEG